MHIRAATAADVPALFRVRTSVEENLLSEQQLAARGITRSSISRMLQTGSAGGWCAEVAGEVVGFAIARFAERDVFALFVLPAFRGRGIGSALLERAVAWLREVDFGPIRLSTGRTTAALAFYRNRGWRPVGSAADDDVLLELRR